MKIILGIINDLDEKAHGADYIEKLTNLTDFWVFNARVDAGRLGLQIDTRSFVNEDELLRFAGENNYDYCIGNWIGHLLRPAKMGEHRHVIKDMVGFCREHNGLTGHLISHPGKIPYLYKQYWCVEMRRYRELGNPRWAAEAGDFPAYTNSAENFHDDYTPLFLAPAKGRVELPVQLNWGTGLLKAWLQAGYSVHNVPQGIRELKHHLYPEHAEQMNLYFQSRLPVTELQQPLQRQYFQSIDYENAKSCIFLFNTDRLDFKVPGTPIDNLVAVCAAFRPYLILFRSGFHEKTSVNFIDYSQISLDFKKWLVEKWDGDNLESATRDFEKQIGRPLSWNRPFHLSYQEAYDQVMSEFGGKQAWLQFWDSYRRLPHTYRLLDLVEKTESVRDLLAAGKRNYLYFSNSFNTEAGLVKWGKSRLKRSLKEMIALCRPHNVVLDGSDIDHHYPDPDLTDAVCAHYDLT